MGADHAVSAFLDSIEEGNRSPPSYGSDDYIVAEGNRDYWLGRTIDSAGIWVGERSNEITGAIAGFIQDNPGAGVALSVADMGFTVAGGFVRWGADQAVSFFKDELTGLAADQLEGERRWSTEKAQAGGAGFVLAGTFLLGGLGALAHRAGYRLEVDLTFHGAAGGGFKVTRKLRDAYMGPTPSKWSKTGLVVQDDMRANGMLRGARGREEFQASDGKWYPIEEADMSHKYDAVKYWNETGRFYGAKSKEVRDWMKDPKNYVLDLKNTNRSAGGQLKDRYLPSVK